jgi:hypothetical protein
MEGVYSTATVRHRGTRYITEPPWAEAKEGECRAGV